MAEDKISGKRANPDKDPEVQADLDAARARGQKDLRPDRRKWSERGGQRHIPSAPGNKWSGKGKGEEGKSTGNRSKNKGGKEK